MVRMGATARVAQEIDLDSVLPVLRAARADSPLGAQMCSPDSERLAEQLRAWFGVPGSSLVVAELDETIVGLALIQLIDVNLFTDIAYVQIEALFVDPEHRRRSAGRALMSQIAVVAARSEAERIVTMPLTGARSEQRFLSGLGFSTAGSRRIADTAALLRRLEQTGAGRERRGRGIEELIARRRRSRGLPATPPRGISLTELAGRAAQEDESSTMQVRRAEQMRRPDSSATTIS